MDYSAPAGAQTPTWPSFLSLTPPRWQSAAAREVARARTIPTARVWRGMALLVGLAVQIVESLLLTRLVMVFLLANPDATFAQMIYGATAPLVAPFQDVFPAALSLLGQPLDATALLAMLVYALSARLLRWLARGIARL